MKLRVLSLLLLFLPMFAHANADRAGTYYVTADSLNVRLSPNPKGKITNKLYRQQKLEVFEVKSGWARISKYYNGAVEGLSGNVARWVSAAYLSDSRPNDKAQPNIAHDPRIKGIPKVGQYGATERDVRILYAAGKYFLDSKKCNEIEYGDKSISKPNTYYLNCGGPNHFFKPSDIPGL
ncbi:SH3 domain-containing protein [Zooshikella sp. RANM57]|uniref:SH3 domain-containing protein n=1 Tax=Zooshikella sp. RANM57 TaxID=3425863 RepID=UPI003D6FE0C0